MPTYEIKRLHQYCGNFVADLMNQYGEIVLEGASLYEIARYLERRSSLIQPTKE
jgi:hypothetical protein